MTRDARFWRNVTIVGLVHLGLLFGLLWWSRTPSRVPKDVVWMEGGAGASSPAAAGTPPPVPPEAMETPEQVKEEPPPEVVPTAKSEIEIPSPTASAT